MKNIKITTKESEQRLDVFLADKLSLSRSQVQKMTKNKQIIVNDKERTAHYKIQDGDKIEIIETKKQIDKKTKQTLPKFKIVTETDDYLIINKPSGVIVHGGEGITELTLVDALIKKYPKIKKVGEDELPARNAMPSVAQAWRPGIVHRLDKEASGLMVVAKTQDMFKRLKKEFKERETLKKYYALVHGQITNETDEINFPISRSVKGYKMAALPRRSSDADKTKTERDAITQFEIAKKFINYTLLNITIKTGRTHQIRVHMSAYSHPIVGDDLYGTKKTREKNEKLKLNRIFLHAYTLGFYDLNGEWQEFTTTIPSELKKFLIKIDGK